MAYEPMPDDSMKELQRNETVSELIEKKIAWHIEQKVYLRAMKQRLPANILDMKINDLADILRLGY